MEAIRIKSNETGETKWYSCLEDAKEGCNCDLQCKNIYEFHNWMIENTSYQMLDDVYS